MEVLSVAYGDASVGLTFWSICIDAGNQSDITCWPSKLSKEFILL